MENRKKKYKIKQKKLLQHPQQSLYKNVENSLEKVYIINKNSVKKVQLLLINSLEKAF
mgnify:CR=1 FL=1